MDLEKVLKDFGVEIEDLADYVDKMDDRAFKCDQIPAFPAPSTTNLNFLKPASQEFMRRPAYIHEYMPPMYPEMELDSGPPVVASDPVAPKPESPKNEPQVEKSSEINPFREIDSVMMTASGFISPAREGRLPDSRTPVAASSLVTKSLDASALEEGEIEDDDDDDNHLPDTGRPAAPVKETPPTPAPKKRGPKPGSKREKKPKPVQRKEDSDTPVSDIELSDDDNYKPPANFSSAKKAQLEMPKKYKPKRSTAGSATSYDEKSPTHSEDEYVKPAAPKAIPPATETPKTGKKRGRKKKSEIAKLMAEQENKSESSDMDICYDAPIKRAPTTAPKPPPPVREEPPLQLPRAVTPPDPSLLPNNPLIPKSLYGFDLPQSTPAKEVSSKEEKKEKRKEEKSEKKKSKKDKKEKKHDKKSKEERKKKKKLKRPPSPLPLFAPSDSTTVISSSAPADRTVSPLPPRPPSAAVETPPPPPPPTRTPPPSASSSAVPKIKIKDIKPEETKSPKLLIKTVYEEKKTPSAAKKKEKAVPSSEPRKKSKKDRLTSEMQQSAKRSRPSLNYNEDRANSPEAGGSSREFVGGGVITTQTVGKYVDNDGTEIWICPGCGKQDDGTPMIGCDVCDDWYHWVCVNIVEEPGDEDWYCPRCRARRSSTFLQTQAPGSKPSKRS